jgi:hypothetical protein
MSRINRSFLAHTSCATFDPGVRVEVAGVHLFDTEHEADDWRRVRFDIDTKPFGIHTSLTIEQARELGNALLDAAEAAQDDPCDELAEAS